jgi:hypothetical protein
MHTVLQYSLVDSLDQLQLGQAPGSSPLEVAMISDRFLTSRYKRYESERLSARLLVRTLLHSLYNCQLQACHRDVLQASVKSISRNVKAVAKTRTVEVQSTVDVIPVRTKFGNTRKIHDTTSAFPPQLRTNYTCTFNVCRIENGALLQTNPTSSD